MYYHSNFEIYNVPKKIAFTKSITVDTVNLHCLLFVAQLIL